MRIDPGSYFYKNTQTGSAKAAPTTTSMLDNTSSPDEGSSSGVAQTDFTNMTRQQLFDWMNGQIRSGAMSLKDSSSFLGMTISLDQGSGKVVDMASDPTRINFVQRASDGLSGALWRGDTDQAARLQSALDTMQRDQGQVTGVDIRA